MHVQKSDVNTAKMLVFLFRSIKMSVMQQLSDTVVMKQGNGIKANAERSKVRLTTFLICTI